VLHQVCICTAPQAQPGPVPSSSELPQASQYKLFSSNHLIRLTVLYVFGQTAPTTLWHIRAYTKHFLDVHHFRLSVFYGRAVVLRHSLSVLFVRQCHTRAERAPKTSVVLEALKTYRSRQHTSPVSTTREF
jgi:hypothetical protein